MREYDRFEKGAANSNTSTRGAEAAARGPGRADHHHDDPEARDVHRRQQGPRDLRRARRHHLRRVPPLAVRRHAHRDHQGVQAVQPVRLHRHADLRRQRRLGRQPAAAHHRAGVRRQAAHLHDRRRDHRQERAAVPHRLRQHDQGRRGVDDKQVSAIDTERALLAPERLRQVVGYTLEHFDQKTKRSGYAHSITNVATRAAPRERVKRPAREGLQRAVRHGLDRRRQALLHRVQAAAGDCRRTAAQGRPDLLLAANEDVEDGYLDEEGFETDALDQSSRDFLEEAIRDYNGMFGTSYDTSADKFQNYYKDLSLRMKNREIDLVIVVNMFLTGFDATTLNTLFVDKSLSPRPDPGLLAHQPHPQLGQDLRQHRLLPRSRAGDQRRHRPVRQQGRARASSCSSHTATTTASTPRSVQSCSTTSRSASRSSARRRRRRSSLSSAPSCACRTS